MARVDLLSFGAYSLIPDVSSGPDKEVVQNGPVLWFDDSTVETAYTPWLQMPAGYTGSGTLKADIGYLMDSATSGKVDWEVSVEAVTSGDSQDLDAGTSFDTANADDETVPGTAGYPSVLSITLSNKDSVVAGDFVRLKVERDADDGTDDTASGDAGLLFLQLYNEDS